MVRKPHPPAEIAAWVAMALIVVSALTFYLWHLNENVRLGWETGRREAEAQVLREDVQRLQTRKAALLAPDRVEKIARELLNLADPQDGQILYEAR